ncbi:PAS domain-containing protein [Tsuneonella sp. HG249]
MADGRASKASLLPETGLSLRESEGRFREFADNSQDALWIIDAETRRLEYLSPAFERIWGIAPHEVMDDLSRWAEFIHPDDRALAVQALPRVLAGEPCVADYRIIRPDRSVRWIRDTGFPIRENGEVKRAGGIAQDVTDLRRAETSLRESEERLALALDVGQLASWDWDLRSGVLTWNDLQNGTECDQEGEGTSTFEAWLARVHPADRAGTVAAIEAARDAREPYVQTFRILHPDGAIRWCSARGRFFYDDDGEPCRMIGVMEDSTQWHESDAALRESEERMRLIVENAEDYAIFTTDVDGMVTDWREGAQNVFGYSAQEMVGQSCHILFTPEDRAAKQPERERATAAEHGKAGDVRWHVRKGGARVFIDGVSTALRNPDGKLIGFLKIGQDVTEQHAAGQRQELLLAELQHRVRNILGMIRSMVRFTAHGHEDIDEFSAHLVGRLDALARTQVLLTREPGARVDLEGLVWDELESQLIDERRMQVGGPAVGLSPKAAEVLTLALHELATNSLKYGALSNQDGRLSVTWDTTTRNGQQWVELVWNERCIRLTPRPITAGFGTELIEERVPYELNGEASLRIEGESVLAKIGFPLLEGASILETTPARDHVS